MIPQSRRRHTSPILGLLLVSATMASGAQSLTTAENNSIPGWKQWTSQLEQLDSQILSRLPERLRNDPQARQEAGRLLLEAVASKSIAALGDDVDYPVFLPSINFYFNIGQPNADTTYRSAAIDAAGSYRIRGEIGSLRILRVGLFGALPTGSTLRLPVPTYYDFKSLHLDASGHFDVLLARNGLPDTPETGGNSSPTHRNCSCGRWLLTGRRNAIRASQLSA